MRMLHRLLSIYRWFSNTLIMKDSMVSVSWRVTMWTLSDRLLQVMPWHLEQPRIAATDHCCPFHDTCCTWYIDGLVQERRNSSALAMELRLSCNNPSICAAGSGNHLRLPIAIFRFHDFILGNVTCRQGYICWGKYNFTMLEIAEMHFTKTYKSCQFQICTFFSIDNDNVWIVQ